MKYIITNQEECVIGNRYHAELADSTKGEVISAGECEMLIDGWTVYGQSHGFNIRAKNTDRDTLNKMYPKGTL